MSKRYNIEAWIDSKPVTMPDPQVETATIYGAFPKAAHKVMATRRNRNHYKTMSIKLTKI